MSNLSEADNGARSPTAVAHRWQFSLHAMLMLTLVVAMAVVRVQVPQASWINHALAVIAFLIVVGLFYQAWDLRTAQVGSIWPANDLRDGWRFAIFWRVALGLWILAVLALDLLDAYHVVSLPDVPDVDNKTGALTRDAMLRLPILVALAASTKRRLCQRPRRRYTRLLDPLGWFALCLLTVLMLFDATLLPMLVHLAIRGIEFHRPTLLYGMRPDPDAFVDLTDATTVFFRRAAWCAALVPVNLVLVGALAWQWPRGWQRRLLIAAPLAATLAIASTFVIWAATSGFASIAPSLAPHIALAPWYRWGLLCAIVGLAALAAGAQFCYRAWGWKTLASRTWRRHPRRYLHERTTFVLFVMAICMSHVAFSLFSYDFYSPGILDRINEVFYCVYNDPTVVLELAITLAAARMLWRNRRSVNECSQSDPFAISLPAWGAVSLALFATIATALPTLYWFCFVAWIQSGRT